MMTVTIAICDNDIYASGKLAEDCRKYFEERDLECEILSATSGEEFLETCAGKEIELAFIDIELPGVSGFETAKYIRLYGKVKKIVFITYCDDMVYDCFEYQPFGFVRKTKWEEDL